MYCAYLQRNKLLTNCQSGFRKVHSTVTALLVATDNWSFKIDQALINVIVFVGLKKAFGMVDYTILLQNLTLYGVSDTSIKWFQWLMERCQTVTEVLSHRGQYSAFVALTLKRFQKLKCMPMTQASQSVASASVYEIEVKMNRDLEYI